MRRTLLQLIEVAPAHTIQLGIGDQPRQRLRPLVHLVHRAPEAAPDHLSVHQRRRVQGVHRQVVHPALPQALGELEREHDLRQLALAVGQEAVVLSSLGHQILKVQLRLPDRCDVHDPRRRRAPNQRQELGREQEVREVVDRERQLEAVLALPAPVHDRYARVVHKHVDAIRGPRNVTRERAHSLER